MYTLCIRYTIDPNKAREFKNYVDAEQGPIRRSGGRMVEDCLPTDFAGPTNEALGLIDFSTCQTTSGIGMLWRVTGPQEERGNA